MFQSRVPCSLKEYCRGLFLNKSDITSVLRRVKKIKEWFQLAADELREWEPNYHQAQHRLKQIQDSELNEFLSRSDGERSEVRSQTPGIRVEEYRDAISARIKTPLGAENQVRELSYDETYPVYRGLVDASEAVPGMKQFFNQTHFDRIYSELDNGGREAQFNIGNDLTLTITSLIQVDWTFRTHIYTVENRKTGNKQIVGYLHSIISKPKPSVEAFLAANLGFDVFIPYRSKKNQEFKFNSRELFEASLRMIRHFRPRVTQYNVITAEQIHDVSVKTTVDGQSMDVQIANRIQNGKFYLDAGLYPEDHLAEADDLLDQYGLSVGPFYDSGAQTQRYDRNLPCNDGPIPGQRYRLEAAPTFGTLNFTGALADYRRYIMPVFPYTFAARLLHFGRYGPESEDNRLQPLFMGYQQVIRGYNSGSFATTECRPNAFDSSSFVGPSTCPQFDQLFGSRMLVGNFEIRFPLFRGIGLRSPPGFPPLTLAVFFDAGVACP